MLSWSRNVGCSSKETLVGRISRLRRGTTVALLTPAQLPLALGPAAAEGLTASLTLSERLESIEEQGFSEDEGVRSLTSLNFSLSSERRNQRLLLGVNTGLAYNLSGKDDGDDFEFEDTSLTLSYAIENRNTQLTFDGAYRRAEQKLRPRVQEPRRGIQCRRRI